MKINLFRKNSKPKQTEFAYSEEDDRPYIENESCPVCRSKIAVSYTCHTYGGNPDGTGWKACIPCSSAGDLYCINDDCIWPGYTWGLNKSNPRSIENEKNRPNWLVGSWPL